MSPRKSMFICTVAAAMLCVSQPATAADINVPGDYLTIQEAVNAAVPGDSIVVQGGAYAELVLVTTPDIEVKATDGATLTGTFSVVADGVSIKNWVIYTAINNQGIQFENVDGCSAKNNTIIGNPNSDGDFRGIWLSNATNCEVKGCYILGHEFDAIGCTGELTGTAIKNNVFEGQNWGMIFFGSSWGATIWDNQLIDAPGGFGGDTSGHDLRDNTSN